MGNIKQTNIKNHTYYFFNDMINIKDFDFKNKNDVINIMKHLIIKETDVLLNRAKDYYKNDKERL